MYSMTDLRYIRDLEFFLFGGVPEEAEEMYEFDFHGHSEIRTTRRAIPALRFAQPGNDRSEQFVIDVTEINWSTGEIRVCESGGESADEASFSLDGRRRKKSYPPKRT